MLAQKRPAALQYSKQSTYELGTLAYSIVTGSRVIAGEPLPDVPEHYPPTLVTLMPQLVAQDPSECSFVEDFVNLSACYSLKWHTMSCWLFTFSLLVMLCSAVKRADLGCAIKALGSLLVSGRQVSGFNSVHVRKQVRCGGFWLLLNVCR